MNNQSTRGALLPSLEQSRSPDARALSNGLELAEGAEAVTQLGGLFEVETAGRLLHAPFQLRDALGKLRRRVEPFLATLGHLDREVVALVDRLQQLTDRGTDGLRRDGVLDVVGGLERAPPLVLLNRRRHRF